MENYLKSKSGSWAILAIALVLPLGLAAQKTLNDFYCNSRAESLNICLQLRENLNDPEMETFVKEILARCYGRSDDFDVVPCPSVLNVELKMIKNELLIFYNTDLFKTVKSRNFNFIAYSNRDLMALTILAHELAHFINGDLYGALDPKIKLRDVELKADEEAGFIFAKLGASFAEATLIVKTQLQEKDGNKDCASREERSQAMERGWMRGSKGQNTTPPRANEAPSQIVQPVPSTLPNQGPSSRYYQMNDFYGQTSSSQDLCVRSGNFSSDIDVEKLVNQIMDKYGLPNRYTIVPCDRTDNATAIQDERGRPYILYNPLFMKSVKSLNFTTSNISGVSGQDWESLTILAHEIGHHLNYHLVAPHPDSSRRSMELEADETAGQILYLFGASLADAQRVMYSAAVPQAGTMQHPPRVQRLEAIERGYRGAQKKYPNALTPTPRQDPPQNPTPPTPTPRQDPIQNPTIPKPAPRQEPIPTPAPIQNPVQKPDPGPVPAPKQEPKPVNVQIPQPAPVPAPQPVEDGIQSIMKNMVLVNGGVFVRGCGPGQDNTLCETDEKPAHQVRISDFYMGKYEVTQREWLEIMGVEFASSNNVGCGNCPVERVSWDDIQIFLSRLNARTGKVFRLPTEAEWEYAARGGVKSVGYRYSGSNDLNEVAWWPGNTENTKPVGTKKPNELGLYDMSGNVWEWCQDWYEFGIYKTDSQSPEMPFNPKGPDQPNKLLRVMRGGGWVKCVEKEFRVSFRKNQNPSVPTSIVGFRLVRDL